MINTIDIKWDLLGARLANLSDTEQGLFFKGFALELERFESGYKAQMQMCFTRDKLTRHEQKILNDILPCLWTEQ